MRFFKPFVAKRARVTLPNALWIKCLTVCCGLLFATANTWGQTSIEKFQLADAYLRAGQSEKAIPLLEDIYAVEPQQYAFYDKLREAYTANKRFEEALSLVNKRLTIENSTNLLSDKASILFKKGLEAEAFQTWDAAINLNPADQNTYRIVYYSLYRDRLFEQAANYLETARAKFNDPKLFNMELAYSYGYAGKFEKAVAEYLTLLTDNPAMLSFVKIQLAQLDQQEGALTAFTTAVDRAIRTDPLNKVYRELGAWLYLEAGEYQKALNANIALDRIENQNGVIIYNFAQTAASANYFDIAEQAYRTIFEQYPTAPMAPNAQLALATMLKRRGETLREPINGTPQTAPNYFASKTAYEQFISTYPNHGLTPQILFELGQLEQAVFLNPAAAERHYEAIAQQYMTTSYYWEGQARLGDLALQQNDLSKARRYFTKVHQMLRTGELAENAQFQLALLDFYEAQFTSATARVEAMNQNTTTDVANDAIELKVLIRESVEESDSTFTILKLYAKAKLFERQRKFSEAIPILDTLIAKGKETTLYEEALFTKANMMRKLGQQQAAIVQFEAIQRQFPSSYLADRCMFFIAEIYEQALNEKQKAIDQYAELLLKYPGSLLLPEVRSRIRKLRGDRISS